MRTLRNVHTTTVSGGCQKTLRNVDKQTAGVKPLNEANTVEDLVQTVDFAIHRSPSGKNVLGPVPIWFVLLDNDVVTAGWSTTG